MLIFPTDLVPNYIKLNSMPKYRRAQMTAHDQFYRSSLQLSNTATGGALDLIFRSYPTRLIDIACKPNSLTASTTSLRQIGWVGAWQFYHQTTQDGHLCFTIPTNHKMWDRIDYDAEFLQYSLNSANIIWRIDNFTNDNQDHIKQTTDFTISLSAELRTPQWT
jgi:hypothetical protein